MFRSICTILAGCVAIILPAQQLPNPTYLNPSALYVGSGPTTLTLTNPDYTAGLTALWNGSPRVTTQGPNGIASIAVTLKASDLTTSQLAQISVVNTQGAVVDTLNCPVVYNVLPSGVAFDATRNLLYLATTRPMPRQRGWS